MKTSPWLVLAALAFAQQPMLTASAGAHAHKIDCESRSACTDSDPQVCGSDGVTYVNKCTFEYAYCAEANDDLFIVSEGACKKKSVTPAPTTTTDMTPSATAETWSDAQQQDDASAVQSDVSLTEVGTSESPRTVETTQTPAPALTPMASASTSNSGSGYENPTDMSNLHCQIKCPNDWIPVCGSDDETYANECHRLAAKCRDPTLVTVHLGECVRTPAPSASSFSSSSSSSYSSSASASSSFSSPTPASTSTLEATASGSVRTKCNPICQKIYEPVCGSNSVTYANQCLLDYASCKDPRVMKASDGKCPRRAKGKVCVPDVCTSVEDPVCGSDGMTYLNECLFNNAKCSAPTLTILHDGECNEDTKLKCATLTCPKFTECREDEDMDVAYCADVCAAERCGEDEECQLLDAECFTAPCSPVATCVALEAES